MVNRRALAATLIAWTVCSTACGEQYLGAEAATERDAAEEVPPASSPPQGEDEGDDFAFEGADEPTATVVPSEVREAQAKVDEALLTRQHRLETETLTLAQERAEFEAMRAAFDKQMNEIQALEKRLDERIGVGEKARQRRMQRIGALAKLLLNMQPQNAADMVAKMSNEDAQELLLTMAQDSERKASKLLAAMSGERAAELGQLYIDRDPKASLVAPASVIPSTNITPSLPAPPTPEPAL